MKIKKLIIIVLCFSFVLLLSACKFGDAKNLHESESDTQRIDVHTKEHDDDDDEDDIEKIETESETEPETEPETESETESETEPETEEETTEEITFSCEEGRHDEVWHEAKEVTCTSAGYDAYVTCRICDYTTLRVIQKCAHEYGSEGKCACGAEKWEIPKSVITRYATDLSNKTPSIDGYISANEYGRRSRVLSPSVVNFSQRTLTGDDVAKHLTSEYMDFYFAYDEDYIYIAVHDAGPEFIDNGDSCKVNDIPYRHNYRFEFGFDLYDPDTYFMFCGGSTTTAWDDFMYCNNGTEKIHPRKSYEFISDSVVHKYKTDDSDAIGDCISFGDVGAVNGNVNHTDGKWAVIMEFKIDKKVVVEFLNETYGTEYENLSDGMWFSFTSTGYKAKTDDLENKYPSQAVRWIGRNEKLVDLIVFGERGDEISVADPHPTQNFCPDGHLLISYEGKAPTYDSVGFEAYEACSVCPYSTQVELPVIKDIFRTGYARADITPPVSEQNPFGKFTNVKDNIYATCVAVNDGEKTVVLVSIDMQSISTGFCDQIRARIHKETGVPVDNIFISATHSHSVPGFGTDSKWALDSFRKIGDAAKAAIADLSDTEMYVGTGKTTGMAWVRRYINSSGEMSSVNPGKFWDTTNRSVSDADDTLQTVRFVRDDKKDIVLINWQAHLAHGVNHFPNSVSADMAHYIRQDVEAGDDVLVAYFAGASGNINLCAPNYTLVEYSQSGTPGSANNYYVNVAHAFAKVVLDTIKYENLTKLETGRIMIEKRTYAAAHKHDTAAEIAAAQARINAGEGSSGDRYLVARNRSTSTTLRLSALSFGELGLITVPYEMFDTNGMQVKERSPFKMTLVLTNADGDYAYMPSYEACAEYGGYETEATYFDTGVAEKVVTRCVNMLKILYKAY